MESGGKYIAGAAIIALIAGCSSTGGFKPVKRQDHFPKQEELQQIKQQPAPEGVFEKVDQVRVAEWRLTGPLPDIIGPVKRNPVDDLDQVAASVASDAKKGVATEAMRCAARELGLFYLEYGALPEPGLQRFIQHRCGASSAYLSSTYQYWDEGDIAWEEANKDNRTIKSLDQQMKDYLKHAPNPEIGAWYGSNDERSIAIAVMGARRVDIEPMPMTVEAGGEFEIKGEFLEAKGKIVTGVVNHGRYGWAQCFPLKAKSPRFHVRCKAQPEDIEAGFEVYARRRGELISNSEFWQRVWPAGNPAQKYVLYGEPETDETEIDETETADEEVTGETAAASSDATENGPDADATPPKQQEGDTEATAEAKDADTETDAGEAEGADAESLDGEKLAKPLDPESFDTSPAAMRKEVLRLINEERARGNMPPVKLADEQSSGAQQLVPHYWQASKSDDRETMHKVMYGLLAGWDVSGPIIDGSFYSTRARGGPRSLVASMRERPGARNVLFDPSFERMSVGLLYEKKPQVLGAIVHGWAFVPEESHTKRVNRLLDYITQFRDVRGLPKIKKQSSSLSYTKGLAEKLESGELQLHEVASRLLNRFAAENQGKPVRAYYFEVHDVTQIEIPDEIIDAVPLEVAVVVAPYQPPNSPWNTYGVAFAYVDPPRAPTQVVDRAADDAEPVAIQLD